MYRVLIVDDEEPVLESYSFILKSGVPGFELVGKARTGYEAINLVYELKPDVVFMDINMPGIDGLDTIEQINKKFPHIVFILSTAYERFDIAFRAIPLGVSEYLVKPVSKQTFIGTLEKIRTKLDALHSQADLSFTSIEEQFIKEIVWNYIDDSQWQRLKQKLHLASDTGLILAIKFKSMIDSPFLELKMHLLHRYKILFSQINNIGIYFFSGKIEPELVIVDTQKALSKLSLSSEDYSLGVGSCQNSSELFESCSEAFANLAHSKEFEQTPSRDQLIEIRKKMGVEDLPKIIELFDEWWNTLLSTFGFIHSKYVMISFFSLLIDDSTDCFKNVESKTLPFNPAIEIPNLESLHEWKQWSISALTWIWRASRQKRTGDLPIPLLKALSFMEANYARSIQLQDVAEHAGVSTAYLSKLFSDYTQTTFAGFLTDLRINNAKKLLSLGSMNIKEISNAIGYSDPNYFSKVFVKVVGLTPSEYIRSTNHEQNNKTE